MKFHEGAAARRIVLLVVLVLTIAATGGCSNFRSSKHLNMAPFAEHTMDLLADVRYGMDAQTAVYLRDYIDGSPVEQYGADWRAFRPMLRGIAAYSIGIVTISKARMGEADKVQKLADVLDEFLRPRIEATDDHALISEAELDEMLANIREQTKYLDALLAAQPLVDAIENFSHAYLDFMDDQLLATRGWLEQKIRDDHAASQDFYEMLIEAQNFAFENLVLLRDYRQGQDPDAMRKLLEKDPQLKLVLPKDRAPTLEDTQAVQERIIYRLAQIRELTAQVQPDLDLFRNKMLELDRVYKNASNNLVKTRITVIVWSRTHRGLAQGVTNPATFDVMGIAKKALAAALPI